MDGVAGQDIFYQHYVSCIVWLGFKWRAKNWRVPGHQAPPLFRGEGLADLFTGTSCFAPPGFQKNRMKTYLGVASIFQAGKFRWYDGTVGVYYSSFCVYSIGGIAVFHLGRTRCVIAQADRRYLTSSNHWYRGSCGWCPTTKRQLKSPRFLEMTGLQYLHFFQRTSLVGLFSVFLRNMLLPFSEFWAFNFPWTMISEVIT